MRLEAERLRAEVRRALALIASVGDDWKQGYPLKVDQAWAILSAALGEEAGR